MTQIAQRAKTASRQLAKLTTREKNDCLFAMAGALEASNVTIEAANAIDMQAGAQAGLSAAMLERLKLDKNRVNKMAVGLREVAALPDPVGRLIEERVR